jgi:phosphatidate cytidylyltransferase
LTLFLIYMGGWFYFLPFAALLGVATYEYSQLVGKLNWRAPLWLLIPFTFLLWITPVDVQRLLLDETVVNFDLVAPALLLGLLAAMVFALWLFERPEGENAPGSWLAIVTGIMLLGWLGSFFFRLRGIEEAPAEWTALAMLGTWIADSGAYVFGKSLGRHKLAPRLSPNKTVEGFVGGAVAGTFFSVVIAYFMDLPLATALVLGLLVSLVSPAGDLGVSMLKRSVGVKDSGTLLPGHGGALDRIDSLIWSMALVYFLVTLTS